MIGVVDPTVGAFLGLLLGASGLLTVAIKRTWSDRDDVNSAYRTGRKETQSEYLTQLADLRVEFEHRITEMAVRHDIEIRRLEDHLGRLHQAVIELVGLVDNPSHVPKAMEILASLSIASHRHKENKNEPK